MGISQTKRDRLQRLFGAYSSNLSIGVSSLRDKFVCPLCFGIFDHNSIDSELLSEEHIISRKLGGKLITLTCKDCNSRDGSGLDSNLIGEFRALDKVSGLTSKPFKGRVKLGDAQQDVEVYLSTGERKLNLIGNEGRSNPKSVRAMTQALCDNPTKLSLDIHLGYSQLKANVAKVRAAYLLMFSYFGYEYILQESVKRSGSRSYLQARTYLPQKPLLPSSNHPRT